MHNRIMIVEDEYVVSLDLKNMLEDLGHQVVATVARGEDVLHTAFIHHPNMVLMDIRLAGKVTGTEAAIQLRQVMDVPVVFLSAYSDNSVLSEAEKSFPYGYLVKPFERRELAATIRMASVKHQSELHCHMSERRLKLATEAAKLSYFELDCENNHLQFLGHHQEWLAEKSNDGIADLLNLIAVSHRSQFLHQLTHLSCINGVWEAGPQLPTGYIEIKAEKISQGSKLSWIGMVADVSERQQNEIKLRQAKTVFDTTSEAILILNEDGGISAVNPAFSKVTGYSLRQIANQSPEQFLYDFNATLTPPFLTELSANHWSGEVCCIKQNGVSFPTWLHICKVRTPFHKKTINHYVLMFSDISALRRAEENLISLVHHDHLTGLGNRRKLEKTLNTEIMRSKRHNTVFAVIYIDLDGFKMVNDTLGHQVGDMLLQTVAKRISQSIRIGDSAARVGGDEFVVILSEIQTPSDCFVVTDKLLGIISQDIELGDNQVSISASIGIALFPSDADTPENLLKCADLAMFNAKEEGKKRYTFFNKGLSDKAHLRVRLERDLRSALQTDAVELQLHYQPIYETSTLEVAGVEALLRWHHPELGYISPERFIQVAEQSNQIYELGDLVCRRLIQDLSTLTKILSSDCYIALNLSAKQFGDSSLFDRLYKFFDSTTHWGRLQFEVTETAFLQSHKLEPTLGKLRSLGASVALDDFGTGYSSLNRLKDLPLDCLKIDRSFISSMFSDDKSLEIVRAVCMLGKALDLQLTAEGVETREQLAMLQQLNCDRVQGFLLAKPMAIKELERQLIQQVSTQLF